MRDEEGRTVLDTKGARFVSKIRALAKADENYDLPVFIGFAPKLAAAATTCS